MVYAALKREIFELWVVGYIPKTLLNMQSCVKMSIDLSVPTFLIRHHNNVSTK